MKSCDVEQKSAGQLELKGVLTFETVPQLLSKGGGLFQGADEVSVGLGAVERSDSAGLALLVEWTRLARQGQKQIRFYNVPAQLRAIARVSGLERVLPLGE